MRSKELIADPPELPQLGCLQPYNSINQSIKPDPEIIGVTNLGAPELKLRQGPIPQFCKTLAKAALPE